ncbi:hypothetical protein IQ273_18880 [Nodosilinea sp. LEGE 07298]|uniref:hypothetical protein n=1 Tax=Nodosilinea sp. LEGE 07298 TaxID=2777970 RepID=UPI00187F2959|nr:hypothetical protein [Nodosilinea sp. LEGE 07298]MBE9111472.1 hypothetical protein [Nodosilinea sp. LEGE 07298]
MTDNSTQIVVHTDEEIKASEEIAVLLRQAAALGAQEALKNAGIVANTSARGLGTASRFALDGVTQLISDTVAEVRTDLKTNPKRFRIGVQRLVAACALTGFVSLFAGVAIGLGDPSHTANQSVPGVEHTVVEAPAEEAPAEAPAE